MAAETTTFTPQKFLASNYPQYMTIPCTVVSGQNLPAGRVVEYDAAGKVTTSGGSNAPAGFLLKAVDASDGDKAGILVVSANVWADQLSFHATQSTNLLKTKLFNSSMVKLAFQDTGEV